MKEPYQIYILMDIKETYDVNELIEQEIGSKPSFVVNTIFNIMLLNRIKEKNKTAEEKRQKYN